MPATMGFAQVGRLKKHRRLYCYHQQSGLTDFYEQTNK
jgi:hypothetical protein